MLFAARRYTHTHPRLQTPEPNYESRNPSRHQTHHISAFKETVQRGFKGIVQRKLRWVESGVNRWVMLQYWGAGHYFFNFKGTLSCISHKTFCRHLSINYW
jgi:hypothetical protein